MLTFILIIIVVCVIVGGIIGIFSSDTNVNDEEDRLLDYIIASDIINKNNADKSK